MTATIHGRFWTLLIISGAYFGGLKAAPHNGDWYEFRQPDGSLVPVRVWGDEYYQHVESPDGYTLVRNRESGWICFARLSSDSSELLPTDSVYRSGSGLAKSPAAGHSTHLRIKRLSRLLKHQENRRRLIRNDEETVDAPQPAPPSDDWEEGSSQIRPLQGVTAITGKFTGLTILIDFSDKFATYPVDTIRDFVNKRGYTGDRNSGSVRDYFFDVSGGKVDYQNVVTGYYRARNAKSYYDNASASFGVRAQELITEALNWLKNEGFDFSTLSIDSRKRILAVNIMYSGSPSQGWSEGLWPHQGEIMGFSVNGLSVRKYQISSLGSSLGIGTFCHENGHMLFKWPDLYDYGGESAGVGEYCIMCQTGAKNPVPPCAYLRDHSGWDVVTDITDMVEGMVFSHIPNTNATFIYRNKNNSSEMFYIESRRRVDRNRTLPDSGFMVWHVDRNGSNNDERRTASSHYLVSLEQADNQFDLERARNTGSGGDLFRAGYKDRFDDETAPAALWWNGSKSGLKLWNMSGVGDTMTFSIGEIASIMYTVTASAGEHGSINPSGKIRVVGGSTIRFAIKPDSGYQTDAITVDGNVSALLDTIIMENIGGDHAVSVVFGLKSALALVSPEESDILYAGDTAAVMWRSRGVTVQGIDLSYSTNGGKTFTPVVATLPAGDTTYRWYVPVVESDSCVMKIADSDGSPSSISGLFSIRKKPAVSIPETALEITVERGGNKTVPLTVANTGTGNLEIAVTTVGQLGKVKINELSVGADAQAPDAVEIWNGGADIDMSRWQLMWNDSKGTSGSYFFPEGFILKSGAVFVINDLEKNDSSAGYLGLNVQWLFSDFLEIAVTLLDQAGRGVDFVKTTGRADVPAGGTAWRGKGVELCSSFVFRDGNLDADSFPDWICNGKGSLSKPNSDRQIAAGPPVTLLPLSSRAAGGGTCPLTVSVDAAGLELGNHVDTVLVYHNDPVRPSPVRIPCIVRVLEHVAVKAPRMSAKDSAGVNGLTFTAAPNPVPPGQRVTFQYIPRGDERKGTMAVYNNVGDCIHRENVDFAGISVFDKRPLFFSWLPRSRSGAVYRKGTCLVRLRVSRSDRSSSIYSVKIALR